MKYRAHLPILAVVAALVIVGAGCASGQDSTRLYPDTPTTIGATDSTAAFSGDPVIWAIGDSLMVGATDQLVGAWPTMLIDAEEGRSFESGIDVLEHQLATGTPDVLVFALGTNNGASNEQIERVMQLATNIDEVVFVNVSVPRPWEAATNTALLEVVTAYATATLVDWKAASEAGTGLFRTDGYHLTADGIRAWVDLIMVEATE